MSNSIQFVIRVFDRLQRSTDFLWQKGYKEPEIKAKMILNFELPRMELSVRKMNILFFLIKESFVEFANKFILRIVDWRWINVASTHLHLLWNNCGVSSSKQKQKSHSFHLHDYTNHTLRLRASTEGNASSSPTSSSEDGTIPLLFQCTKHYCMRTICCCHPRNLTSICMGTGTIALE